MTEEERLQEYLKQNAPTEERKKPSSQPRFKKIPLNPKAETPLRWYITDSIFYFIKAIFAAAGVTFVTMLVFDSFIYKVPDDQFIYTLYFALAILLLFTINRLIRLGYYIRWINGGLYPLQGWDEFMAKRTDKFWGGAFTNIRITVKLTHDATNLHREATSTFLEKWVANWENRYKKMEWESGSGKPNDFRTDGKSIYGDISERGLHRIVSRMVFHMPRLASLLGKHLDRIVIESGSKEIEYTSSKVKADAHEKQSMRESLRSLKED